MTKTILLTLTYLVGAGELILAIYFWVTNSKNEIRRVMALLAFTTSIWVILSAALAYRSNSDTAIILNRSIYFVAVFLLTSIVHLSLIYPNPVVRLDRLHKYLFYIPTVFLATVSLCTNAVVFSTRFVSGFPEQPVGGSIFPFYNIYLIILFALAMSIFFYQRNRADGQNKSNISIILASFLIGGLPAVYIDLVSNLVSQGSNFNYLIGNLSTVIWLGATTYILKKK